MTDLRAHLEAEQRAIERERMAADEAERQARTEATRGTLRALLAGYTSGLERAEKVDWKDAESILRLHVLEPFPELADRKAAEIKPAELRPVLARLVDAKKGRTAGKARSYLHAAYAAAIRADFDPDAPQSLCGFRIESNPVAAMPSMAHYNKAGQRVLSEAELQAYMARLSGLSTMTRLALELDLMLGGQRPTQLLRVTSADVDVTADPGKSCCSMARARASRRGCTCSRWSAALGKLRIPLMADSDSIPIADSVPGDGGHVARVS
ncbi:hypothetical protein H0I39_00190 [Ottowia beijingensis]|uniref:Core-binding (CB) domain-containing protein n=1 Tax=Ottowia beijingensis TaxID=1207057 RepID=A0A853IJX2_9BURK|nr:hypothetical protein [Ottowia beijingensis]NZA00592.1 hypothetical protein [Ottowia beijingensis]